MCAENDATEAERYAAEAQREAEAVFRVRTLVMLKASLEHPDALETLWIPGTEPKREPVQERLL